MAEAEPIAVRRQGRGLKVGDREDLVPASNFYRHLEAKLDLGFARDLVRSAYNRGGRPSVDPTVFFKLQLVLFFDGLRSERELTRVAADRLSIRWYLGYDLDEELPDHSSLTRIRQRYGLAVFRRFFEAIVEKCRAAGPVIVFTGPMIAAARSEPDPRTRLRSPTRGSSTPWAVVRAAHHTEFGGSVGRASPPAH